MIQPGAKSLRKIAVVGRGTAGSLAAASVSRLHPDSAHELHHIYDSRIPVIGVGEGSWPSLVEELHRLTGLPHETVQQRLNGTRKYGVAFEGWGCRNRNFTHYFTPQQAPYAYHLPADVMAEGNRAARRHGLSIHLDGARVFNAAVASGLPPARFAEGVDTVQFCFSKGLGAPVGSILCGSADLVAEARYLRKRLGGAMRQAGIIAAPARIALRDWPRLSADHELASRMARGLADRHPGAVDPEITETNMVRVEVGKLSGGWAPVRARLKESGVVVRDPLAGTVRLVTHRDVDDADVERLLAAFSPD